ETRKSFLISFAFSQDRIPAQSGLRRFENKKLKDPSIIVHGYTPLRVMIVDVIGLAEINPRTAAGFVHCFHGRFSSRLKLPRVRRRYMTASFHYFNGPAMLVLLLTVCPVSDAPASR